MANIPIAPDNHVGILNCRIGDYLVEGIEEFVFFILFFAASPADGQVEGGDNNVAIFIGVGALDVAAHVFETG